MLKKDQEIILISQTLKKGGAEKFIVNFANLLVKNNFIVKLIIFKKDPEDYQYLLNKKIEISYLKSRRSIFIPLELYTSTMNKKKGTIVLTNMRSTSIYSILLLFNKKLKIYLREANIISPIINKLSNIKKIIYLFYIKFLYEFQKGSMLDLISI